MGASAPGWLQGRGDRPTGSVSVVERRAVSFECISWFLGGSDPRAWQRLLVSKHLSAASCSPGSAVEIQSEHSRPVLSIPRSDGQNKLVTSPAGAAPCCLPCPQRFWTACPVCWAAFAPRSRTLLEPPFINMETKSQVPQLCPGTTTGGRATVANSAHCLPAVRAWPLACGDVSPSRQTRSNQQEAAVDGSVFWPGHLGGSVVTEQGTELLHQVLRKGESCSVSLNPLRMLLHC